MPDHEIVSREAWTNARLELLAREKEFTRQRDELSAARRALPWVRVDSDYAFNGEEGQLKLIDLFDGLNQLTVYHFMFDDDWQAGCKSCSFWADNYNGFIHHLRARDVAFCAVSKAPLDKLLAFRKRMGWTFRWVQSPGNAFGRDYGVSFSPEDMEAGKSYNYSGRPAMMPELPGLSVFIREGDDVYHTYSCYARGLDMLNAAYHHLDLTPKGRDEGEYGMPMEWVRLHDEY